MFPYYVTEMGKSKNISGMLSHYGAQRLQD